MLTFGITNRRLCTDFYVHIKKIAKCKLDYLIIREKDLLDIELLNLSKKIKNAFKDSNIKIIINSNINVAEGIEADGVQLSFKDFIEFNNTLCTHKQKNEMEKVNKFNHKSNELTKNMEIGVSIHNYEEGIEAFKLGVNYVVYGHVFETECKKHLKPRGCEDIFKLSKKISIPIIGLGGINENNYKQVIQAGASGIAVMSSLMKCKNPEKMIGKFLENQETISP